MKLSLYDMHCDTAYEMYKTGQSLISNNLSVSIENTSDYINYFQNFAIYSDKHLDNDSAFYVFEKICRDLENKIENIDKRRFQHIISVEDARILNNDLSRLDYLHYRGVKILTPLWSGVSCIGGAHNTLVGLTNFGKEVVKRCMKLGIVIDISHASPISTEEIFSISGTSGRVIATHSCAFSINQHSRNLTDKEFLHIVSINGLVGISLCCEHLGVLSDSRYALSKVIEHIEHFMSLDGENTVCFGCDFDGADVPYILRTPNSLIKIANELAKLNYTQDMINKLFSENAKSFINKNFKNIQNKKKGKENEILQYKRYRTEKI